MKLTIGFILAVLVLVVGFLVYRDSQNKRQREEVKITPTVTLTPTKNNPPENIPQDFKTFKSSEFSIKYHPEMQVRNSQIGQSFILLGPTQSEGTELFDGINLTIQSGSYNNENFKEFVESELEKISNDGVSEVTEGIISVSLGDKEGYEFKARGLGEYSHLYFEKGEGQYIHVILNYEDPTNSGFEEIVKSMITSLKF